MKWETFEHGEEGWNNNFDNIFKGEKQKQIIACWFWITRGITMKRKKMVPVCGSQEKCGKRWNKKGYLIKQL